MSRCEKAMGASRPCSGAKRRGCGASPLSGLPGAAQNRRCAEQPRARCAKKKFPPRPLPAHRVVSEEQREDSTVTAIVLLWYVLGEHALPPAGVHLPGRGANEATLTPVS